MLDEPGGQTIILGLLIGIIVLQTFAFFVGKAQKLTSGYTSETLAGLAKQYPKKTEKIYEISKKLKRYDFCLLCAYFFVHVLSLVLLTSACLTYQIFSIPILVLIVLIWTFLFVLQFNHNGENVHGNHSNYIDFISIVANAFMPLAWVIRLLIPKVKLTTDVKHNSWENIMQQIEVGHSSGELDSDEFEMIDGVISMHAKMAREVMVPRIDAFMIDITNDNERSIDDIIETNFSRVPVYHEDKDNIVGVVHIKKLLRNARLYGFDHTTIRQVMQPAFFVPETIMIDELLFRMKESQNQLAILLDEYGGVVGLVTLEDLLEEIVGDIEDETDEHDEVLRQISEKEFIVLGKMSIDDFNTEFSAHLEANVADTVAGYIIEQLGFFPKKGQVLNVRTAQGIILETHSVISGERIVEVRVILTQKLAQEYTKRAKQQDELQKKLGK